MLSGAQVTDEARAQASGCWKRLEPSPACGRGLGEGLLLVIGVVDGTVRRTISPHAPAAGEGA
jgi:hypothetical protein